MRRSGINGRLKAPSSEELATSRARCPSGPVADRFPASDRRIAWQTVPPALR